MTKSTMLSPVNSLNLMQALKDRTSMPLYDGDYDAWLEGSHTRGDIRFNNAVRALLGDKLYAASEDVSDLDRVMRFKLDFFDGMSVLERRRLKTFVKFVEANRLKVKGVKYEKGVNYEFEPLDALRALPLTPNKMKRAMHVIRAAHDVLSLPRIFTRKAPGAPGFSYTLREAIIMAANDLYPKRKQLANQTIKLLIENQYVLPVPAQLDAAFVDELGRHPLPTVLGVLRGAWENVMHQRLLALGTDRAVLVEV